jgi:hypothetical protein
MKTLPKKKLILDVDALSVRSFETTRAGDGTRGTVLGAQQTTPPADDCTCDASCWYTQACTPPTA